MNGQFVSIYRQFRNLVLENAVNLSPSAISLALMAVAALFGLILIRKGQRDREWHLVVRRRNTQTRRYALVVIGQAIIIASVAWLVTVNSADDIQQAIGLWFTKGPIGYGVAILSLLAFASPLITVLALLDISLRHPSEMAHGGEEKYTYCFTKKHRQGKCQLVRIEVVLDLKTGKGKQIRTLI